LRDIILLDGPHQETEEAVAMTLQQWPLETPVLIEGNCSSVPERSRTMYVLRCPLLQSAKSNMRIMAARADLLVVNRFPGCTPAEEAALLAVLRDCNPRANQVSGSVQDAVFIETVEAAVLDLLPLLHSA
jgi:G3E family GTPase